MRVKSIALVLLSLVLLSYVCVECQEVVDHPQGGSGATHSTETLNAGDIHHSASNQDSNSIPASPAADGDKIGDGSQENVPGADNAADRGVGESIGQPDEPKISSIESDQSSIVKEPVAGDGNNANSNAGAGENKPEVKMFDILNK